MGEFTNSVKLSDAERFSLLSRLDESAKAEEKRLHTWGCNRRADERLAYRVNNVAMLVVHPAGSVSRVLVCARNLSAGGLGVLHGGFLHPGTECRILLASLDGNHVVHKARVVSSRHLRGRLHEIGMQFHTRINVDQYIDEHGRTAADAAVRRAVASPGVNGPLVFVGGGLEEHRTLIEHLRAADLNLMIAATTDDGRQSVQYESAGVVLIDVKAIECDVDTAVETLSAAAGPEAIILVIEADATLGVLPHGVTAVLTRPVEASMIFEACRDVTGGDQPVAA